MKRRHRFAIGLTLLCSLLGAGSARALPKRLSLKRLAAKANKTLFNRWDHQTALSVDHRLRAARVDIKLEPGGEVPDDKAKEKRYGDSWTCRNSTNALRAALGDQGIHLKLDSSGKKVFNWGAEGLVDFHYYAVDSLSNPRVLVDPTASSNFARDARPDGLIFRILLKTGKAMGDAQAAVDIAKRIETNSGNGLLILNDPTQILIFKGAMEQAAKVMLTRDFDH
jgi:hypothetical protein